MKRDVLDALLRAQAAREPAAVLTDLADGAQVFWHGGTWDDMPPLPPSELVPRLEAALREDRSTSFEVEADEDREGGRYFLQVFNPAPRLIVVGAVHIAQPLVAMAALAGYAVTLVDPRDAWASAERFAGVEIDRRWPDEALASLGPDPRTAIVTLTHDPKLDDPALQAALRSRAFYIGSLGSRRTHARRLERLREAGFAEKDLTRLHGPVGLDIGAVSPAEIATSILAEITRVRRRPPSESAAE